MTVGIDTHCYVNDTGGLLLTYLLPGSFMSTAILQLPGESSPGHCVYCCSDLRYNQNWLDQGWVPKLAAPAWTELYNLVDIEDEQP